jgi:hypothetical protein
VIETTERYADGLVSNAELSRAHNRLLGRSGRWFSLRLTPRHVEEVRMAAAKAAADGLGERRYQCRLLHCVFGTPLRRRRAIDPSVLAWNGGVVPGLAQQIYDDRSLPEGTLDPIRLAVLADALEEAGVTDADLLGHLRDPAPHVRGCWPLDLLLGTA